ncbi:MAG: PQQ-like beta-propeller repeat protein [Dehalococcoidia bacterium]|nr:PQQ-like beta-propeller repeat protein [Dehalococcoidia bacterium]
MSNWRRLLGLVSLLCVLVVAMPSGAGSTSALLSDEETSAASTLSAWTTALSLFWTQTLKADFDAGYRDFIDTETTLDSALLQSSIAFYAFRGNNTTDFWRYDSLSNEWTSMASAPGVVGAGGGLAFPRDNAIHENRYIYALQGGGSSAFWRYDIVTNTWKSDMPAAPGAVNAGGYLRWGGNQKLYAYQGGTTALWVFDISTNVWSTLASTSAATGAGASLVWTGDDYLYGTLGGVSDKFLRYSISGNAWSDGDALDVPGNIGAGAELSYVNKTFTLDDETTTVTYRYVYASLGGGSNAFYRYDPANNTWSAMTNMPGSVTAGGTLRWNGEGFIYAFQGGSINMWRYNILLNTWRTTLTPTPSAVTNGGALCSDGSSYLYAFQGGSTVFWRYNRTTDYLWAPMAPAPEVVSEGAALAYTGNYIYALRGGGSTDFWRYSISGNSWSAMASTPDGVGYGGALAWTGGDSIYALRGGGTTGFWRYSISANSWELMPSTPLAVSYGGSLAYKNTSNTIYAVRGGNTNGFFGYDLATGTWSTLANVTGAVGYGGAMVNVPGNFVYVMRGNATAGFYRFNWRSGKWQNRTSTPSPVGTGSVGGGALAYAGNGIIDALRGTGTTDVWRYTTAIDSWGVTLDTVPAITGLGAKMVGYVRAYVTVGTLESQVFDSGAPNTQWDLLEWDETLASDTDITFEVRASNTLFLVGDLALPWISVGGSSGVQLGNLVPPLTGRYVQWRATLTTSNILVTPELKEVRLYYTPV